MRQFLAAVFGLLFLSACSVSPLSSVSATAESVVKVDTGGGHGSAFHMGDGFLVTAAHVVKDAGDVEIKTSAGEKHKAQVLWVNTTYDIALLKIESHAKIDAATLSCRVPDIGEAISAKGNPGPAEFITVWGKVAGAVRSMGPWREVVVTDITTVPGQSGGPVYDSNGHVVGVTVGVMATRVGFGASLVGVGYAVPGKTVCGLLARSV